MSLTDNRLQQIIDIHGGNFNVREFGGERTRMNPEMVSAAARFRNWHGYSTLITSAYRDSGAHKIGATDIVLYKQWKEAQPDPMELWRLATTWPFWGVGIYFDWFVDGDRVVGLHTDIVQPGKRDRPLRWIRAEGVYYYQSTADGKFYDEEGQETTLEAEIEEYL